MIHNENNKYDETENNTHFVYFNEEIKIFYIYYNIYVKYKKTKEDTEIIYVTSKKVRNCI